MSQSWSIRREIPPELVQLETVAVCDVQSAESRKVREGVRGARLGSEFLDAQVCQEGKFDGERFHQGRIVDDKSV